MTAESRRGKEFSKSEREEKKKELDYHCEGCGRRVTGRRTCTDPHAVTLEGHHEVPIARGGNKKTRLRMLCGPGCHGVADVLAIEDGILLGSLEEKIGPYALQEFERDIQKGKIKKVERKVKKRLRRAVMRAS